MYSYILDMLFFYCFIFLFLESSFYMGIQFPPIAFLYLLYFYMYVCIYIYIYIYSLFGIGKKYHLTVKIKKKQN